jgi:hypothetical protein
MIENTFYYVPQEQLDALYTTAIAQVFGEYRMMFLTLVVALAITVQIALSTAKLERMTTRQFLHTYWIELSVVGSILLYGVWSLFHFASLMNGGLV